MNTRPTPETDKFFATFADGEAAPSHAEYYARLQDLERERDEARGQRDRLAEALKECREDSISLISFQRKEGYHKSIIVTEKHIKDAKEALQSLTPNAKP